MLNSQKLQEVRRRFKVGDIVTNVQIQGVLENTRKNDILNNTQTKIETEFNGANGNGLDASLNDLEKHVSYFESVLEEIAQFKYNGKMLLKSKFKVYGISNIAKKLGEDLKYIGYKKFINNEYFNKTISYNICKGQNDITISFFDNSVVFSIKRNLGKIQDISDIFLEAKECMILLYNQTIKKIKE